MTESDRWGSSEHSVLWKGPLLCVNAHNMHTRHEQQYFSNASPAREAKRENLRDRVEGAWLINCWFLFCFERPMVDLGV